MPCLEHKHFYLSPCPKCPVVTEPETKDDLITDIMNDLREITDNRKPKATGKNLEKTTYEFTHKVLVEGGAYILTEALNSQPRARWLIKSREAADELLALRKQKLEAIMGELYAAETVRVVVQQG